MGTQEWGSPNSWAALRSEQRGTPFRVDVPCVVLSASRTDPRLLNGDPFWVTYGSMQIVIYKNTEDETSHALGLVVPPVGTTSPNGWDNNRFRSQAIFGIETPQCDVCLYLHQDRCTLIYWCRINFIYTLHTPLHTPLIPLT